MAMDARDPADPLLAAALSVTDGDEVDWERRLAETPELRASLSGLRIVAAVAAQHRGPAVDGEPELFRWGSLDVRRLLGHGTFGDVYVAFDPTLGREVALKLARADTGVGALTGLGEARRLASVRHPNVVTVFGADVHDGRAGLWMELIEGRTLDAYLAGHGPLGAREAALVGLELCGALAAVHAAGLVHGDVKAANVMRAGRADRGGAEPGRIVLMDFGAGATAGTPLAAAPELLAGKAPTVASDLYALGVLLYQLVTGRPPITATTLAELRQRHASGESVPLRSARPELPAAFVAAVDRALAPDPARRFASAAEMERALRDTLPSGARPRRAWPVIMALALVAVLAVALWRGRAPQRAIDAPVGSLASPPAGAPALANPPAAATPAALPPLAVDARLFRVGERGREALGEGGRVAPGDRLFLELESAATVYAYVLNEDDSARVFVLFPLAGHGERNPLAGGRSHQLPGREATGELDWEVTSAGGRETFLVVASSAPVPEVERALSRFHPASEGSEVEYVPLDEATLRSVSRVVRRETPAGDATGRLGALQHELERGGREHIWTRLVRLANPAR